MWSALGALVDFVHALAMAAWVVGLPLLFVRRWPRLRLGYAIFAVGFVVLTRASMAFLGECFLTTVSRYFWEKAPAGAASGEWFTVRLAYWVFGMAPSHRAIAIVSEILVFVTAIGVLYSVLHRRTVVAAAATLLLGGCARQVMLPTPVTSATSPRVTACPFGVPTARLDAVDVEGGLDVVVTADERYLPAVRARADNQARVKGPGWRSGPGHFGEHEVSHDHGLRLWKLATSIPRVDVSSTDTPNGSVIHVTTQDPRRVAELRGRLRDRVKLLSTRTCSF
jgi:hypothetical protein